MKNNKIEWEMYNVSEDYPRIKNKKALVAFVEVENREEFDELFSPFTKWTNENGMQIHANTAFRKLPALIANIRPRSKYKSLIFITQEEFEENFTEIEKRVKLHA